MKIEGSKNTRDLFSIFHDGLLAVDSCNGERLNLAVEIEYLAARINPTYRKFHLHLFGVRDLRFSTWPRDHGAHSETLTGLDQIFRSPLEVLESRIDGQFIVAVCNQPSSDAAFCGGELRIRCSYVTVSDESGRFYSIRELQELSESYWEEWSKRHQS